MNKARLAALFGAVATMSTLLLSGVLSAVPAGAATGPAIATPEEGGVQVSNAQFRFVRADVFLRNASQYASAVPGGLGQSIIVQGGGRWYVLGVSNTPTSGPWSPAVAVFNPSTKTLVCASTLANCTDQSGGFGSRSYPTGDTVREQVNYDNASGLLKFTVVDLTASVRDSYAVNVGAGVSFRVVRIGSEFSTDPFSSPTFHAPASDLKTATFSNVALFNNRGKAVPLATGYATTSPLVMTGAGSVTEASPGPISDGGFSVFLRH